MQIRMTYQYRLYDSKQNRHLDETIDIAAEIWNHCIALHRRYYKLFGKHLSDNKLKKHLAKLKKRAKYKHWNELGSQAIQDVAERIGRSYKAFFDHVKGKRQGRKSPPRFKKKCNYTSCTLKQSGYKFLENNRIQIMGHTYKYVQHRPFEGTIKTITIRRNKLGEYYISISVIREEPEGKPRTGKAVGLDFGLNHFLTTDNGEKIDSPQWYKAALNELRQAHRRVSRCKKGSRNRRRAIQDLERLYARISNRRRDWFFKLANQLTEEYSIICVEDLTMDAMKRLWGRKVSDLAFAEFIGILEWVCRRKDCTLVKVDRWFSSTQVCYACGEKNTNLTLKDREWTCPHCGTRHDRDTNAAANILSEGLRILAA